MLLRPGLIPCCQSAPHSSLVRKWSPESSLWREPEPRGMGWGKCSAGACPPLKTVRQSTHLPRNGGEYRPNSDSVFRPWSAGANRHERMVRKCTSAPAFVNPAKVCPVSAPGGLESRRGGGRTLELQPPIQFSLPWCAGASRDQCWYENDLPSRHSGENRSPGGWGGENVARSKIMPKADSPPENSARSKMRRGVRGACPPLQADRQTTLGPIHRR